MWTVRVLGPFALHRDGVPVQVPPGKTTELLIRLALDAGDLVRTDRLIEDLWGSRANRNALQAKVSKLRRAAGDPSLVTGGPDGYTLHVDPEQVDALGVLHLGSFRGEILPDAGDGEWVAPHRSRLEEVRLRLTEESLAGRGEDAVGELEALVAAHPLREGLWRLLISALARAGRPADALDAYARVRDLLADELGLDPGPALRALQGRILRQEAGPRTGNLPGLSAALIGRAADLDHLTALIAAHRLVTVVGPAGVGKTRLAVEAGREAGGAWLARLDTAGTVWQSVSEAVGVGEPAVLDRLRGLDAPLILDNCEHVADEAASAAARMLDAAPGLRILATSQVPLGLDGEIVHELAPLGTADSVTLFRDRATRQRRTFGADADPATLRAVCEALDGLPLAIELAAARAKVLSVQEIAKRLDDRFALLHDPAGRRPERQQTLRSAIGWSYDLLFPDDQAGLQALATFSGGAPLDAAEAVLTALGIPASSAVDVIARLADRSLAAAEVTTGGAVRYRLLDSVREFGLARLRESGRAGVAQAAHAAWFGAAGRRVARGIRGADQAAHLFAVRAERANIDTALSWAVANDPVLALRMANSYGWAWVFLGAGADAAERSRTVLAAAGDAAAVADRVDGLLFAGWFEASGGDLGRAVDDVRAAITLADTDNLRGRAGLFLAFVHSQQGRPHDALTALAAAHIEDPWEAGASYLLTAWAQVGLGRVAEARAASDEALRRLTPLGDGWALNHAEALLGGLAQAEHRYADATGHLARAADAAHRLGFLAAGSLHRANLGRAYEQAGDRVAAAAALAGAIVSARTAGDLRIVALAQVRLARVQRAAGDRTSALSNLEAAQRWYATAGGGDGARLAEHLAAVLAADASSPDAASRLEMVLGQARADDDAEIEVLTLDRLAALTGDPAYRGQAEARLAAARHLVSEGDRIDVGYGG